jgi:signal transduction histidine kinase
MPGWRSGGASVRGASDTLAESRSTQLFSRLLRPTSPPLLLGIAVAALLIAGESVLVNLLERVGPGNIFGVVFLLGVLVVATLWGFWVGTAMALVSAVVYVHFHHMQTGGTMTAVWEQNWVAITIFLVVALAAAGLAGLARTRAAEAIQRRWQVEASHRELGALAEQQAALRRVATLVARGVTPSEVFAVVADELARCLHVVNAGLLRYEADGTGVVVGGRYEPGITTMPGAGNHIQLRDDDLGTLVLRTGRPARTGIGSLVGVPIVVHGRLWGAAIVGATGSQPMPADTEERVADFADLVATAIANAATRTELQVSRDELSVLAEQQAALRRIATLVACGVSPSEVFSAVALELAGVFGVQNAAVWRYEPNGEATLLAAWEEPGAARIREQELPGGVGAPIIVDGQRWGEAVVGSARSEPLPPGTEERVGDFADLVATAIANAQTQAELAASRVRIVAAADDARRRIERDLHDGAQQRLVSLGLGLRTAEACVPPELQPLREQIADLVTSVAGVSKDLQDLSRGIHPAILSKGGLGPALKTLARRSDVPVELDLAVDRRLPESAEVTVYYVVAESLTNAAKHAQASVVRVGVETGPVSLRLSIQDDGVGGADMGKGSGLVGLTDRVEAIGGQMTISSHPGSGTSLLVEIPC